MSSGAPGREERLPHGAVEVRRLIPATPEEIFQAWTDPELIQHWMSPVGTARAEVDLRPGGRFRVVMVGEGVEIEHTGEYLEIDRPERLVFTWQSPYTGDRPSMVTVVLHPGDDDTELVLTHEHLPEEATASHGQGWGRMLERLAEHLSSKEGR